LAAKTEELTTNHEHFASINKTSAPLFSVPVKRKENREPTVDCRRVSSVFASTSVRVLATRFALLVLSSRSLSRAGRAAFVRWRAGVLASSPGIRFAMA
jgi:hypothetical protein